MHDIAVRRFRGGFAVVWYEGGRRRRYRLDAKTEKEARSEAVDVYRQLNPTVASVTVESVWEAYRESLGEKPTAATIGYTGKAVLEHFGSYRPDQITIELCREYAALRMGGGKSQGSVHTELGHLMMAMNWAKKAKIIDEVPHVWRPSKPKPKDRWLTEAEIERLLDATVTPHIRLAILLLLGTAARMGAVLDLTWDRVDLERRQISYEREDSVTRKGRATVPINDGLQAALTTHKAAALSNYVVEYAGGPVKNIAKGVGQSYHRAGIEGATVHTLRHTAAVHLAAAGVRMERIAQMLGHSNTSITYSTYARFAPDHLRAEAQILDFTKLRRAR